MTNKIQEYRCFGGLQTVYSYRSAYLNGDTEFAVYVPEGKVRAVLFYLSGLTCSWENVMAKSGIQRIASELGVVFVAPDTSPRGEGVADNEAMNLGQGAGFYVNATESPWAGHYRMYDYVVKELPTVIGSLVEGDLPRGVLGHSMGGHGALVVGIRNPQVFGSVSAFAPICNPIGTDWGRLAFGEYLGADESKWVDYDACELLGSIGYGGGLLVDQGSDDSFLLSELRPDNLAKVCRGVGVDLELNMRAGYDHSYYFVSSFLESHVRWHLDKLGT